MKSGMGAWRWSRASNVRYQLKINANENTIRKPLCEQTEKSTARQCAQSDGRSPLNLVPQETLEEIGWETVRAREDG